jgi:multidrug efflux system membrane fusion protein
MATPDKPGTMDGDGTMRIISILTAALVAGALWLLIMDRDRLDRWTGRDVAAPEPAQAVAAPAAAVPETASAQSVLVREIAAQPLQSGVLLRGRTEAARSVEMRAETAGRVISAPLPRGTQVDAGAVLCRLDPGTRPAALTEAEARLAEADLTARNTDVLREAGNAAETRRLAAQSALAAARSAVAAMQADLARTEITAPFAGLLEDDSAETGTLLQPGGLCATVVALDPLRLVGFAAERDVARIAPGAQAGGRLADGQMLAGTVSFVARSADAATRTFRVEITVPNPEGAIRDGQTAELLIATPGVSAHLVPASALTLDDDGHVGLRLADADNRARFARVTVLRDSADGIWVSGLPDPARVIVRGQDYVTDGVALAVTMEGSAP